ncbi:hypothetical protein HHI36_005408, partial [Cryptolaemus montrouzieri]
VNGLLLFSTVIAEMLKEIEKKTSKVYLEHKNMESITISARDFADDIVLFVQKEED